MLDDRLAAPRPLGNDVGGLVKDYSEPRQPVDPPSALELTNIRKRFGSVVALDGADFEVKAGEVHALLGENGAGKTTLMNIASGIVPPDGGRINIQGRDVALRSPGDATSHGVGMVHQHFRLVRTLTVAQNLHLGWRDCPPVISETVLAKRTAELSERYQFDVDPSARISQLSISDQQRVAILRSLVRGAQILVLDEPTSALSPPDAERLFDVIRAMRDAGRTVVFISHKLHEVLAIADRITVLRAGRRVSTLAASETDVRSLASLMVGHQVEPVAHRDPRPGRKALTATSISTDDDRGSEALRGVSLAVRSGEIVGVAGVSGNGQRELAEVLTGMRPVASGSIAVGDRDVHGGTAGAFLDAGVGHVPEELRTGLVFSASVELNAAMKKVAHAPLRRSFLILRARLRSFASELMEAAGLSTVHVSRTAGTLSGGQAQRLVVQRELDAATRVLVVVNGTIGLDVDGAKRVHERLLQARDRGVAILLISEDLDELLQLSDRVVVLFKGEIVGSFGREEYDREAIGLLMGGDRGELLSPSDDD